MNVTVINDPATLAEVEAAFGRYEAALVANDVAVLDELFHDAPETLRYGVGENLHGAEEIRAYRASRMQGPPPRRVLRQVVTSYGRDFAVANISFHPETSERVGRQSQAWVRFPEGWRIVAAHVSWLEA